MTRGREINLLPRSISRLRRSAYNSPSSINQTWSPLLFVKTAFPSERASSLDAGQFLSSKIALSSSMALAGPNRDCFARQTHIGTFAINRAVNVGLGDGHPSGIGSTTTGGGGG